MGNKMTEMTVEVGRGGAKAGGKVFTLPRPGGYSNIKSKSSELNQKRTTINRKKGVNQNG